jgi:hypothetical protein
MTVRVKILIYRDVSSHWLGSIYTCRLNPYESLQRMSLMLTRRKGEVSLITVQVCKPNGYKFIYALIFVGTGKTWM